MPESKHSHSGEKRVADVVRQLVFGIGHGLISILGLTIGVASATSSSRTVAIAAVVGMLTGLATLVTLQFLSAKTQKQIYEHMIEKEDEEFERWPDVEKSEMRKYYIEEGFTSQEADSFVNRLSLNRDRWLKAHVTHILEFIPGKTGSPIRESVVLGLSHLLGSFIALLPYLILTDLNSAIWASIAASTIALLAVSSLRTKFAGGRWYVGAAEFLGFGIVALFVGYLVGILMKGFI